MKCCDLVLLLRHAPAPVTMPFVRGRILPGPSGGPHFVLMRLPRTWSNPDGAP